MTKKQPFVAKAVYRQIGQLRSHKTKSAALFRLSTQTIEAPQKRKVTEE